MVKWYDGVEGLVTSENHSQEFGNDKKEQSEVQSGTDRLVWASEDDSRSFSFFLVFRNKLSWNSLYRLG